MSCRQIAWDARYMIARRQYGFNRAETADILGCHQSSISRECRRNGSGDGPSRLRSEAERACALCSWSRRNNQFSAADWRLVERRPRQQWSPEQIAGRLRRVGTLSSSHETIYTHVWRDKARSGQDGR